MPAILSLSPLPKTARGALAGALALAAGSDGLFAVDLSPQPAAGPVLRRLAQPMSQLVTAAVSGDRVLVGGSPHGVAWLALSQVAEQGQESDAPGPEWRGGWMDYTQQPVIALAPMPAADELAGSDVILAGAWNAGILRSEDGGRTWRLSNTGLADTRILTLAWAPPRATGWPVREIAFAGAESGLYRSPAGGRAWRAADGIHDSVHAVAASSSFADDGLVLAVTSTSDEGPTRLWRSTDSGRSFATVDAPSSSCQALACLPDRFVAACADGLWSGRDGLDWRPVRGSAPSANALALLPTECGLLAGGPDGVTLVSNNHVIAA